MFLCLFVCVFSLFGGGGGVLEHRCSSQFGCSLVTAKVGYVHCNLIGLKFIRDTGHHHNNYVTMSLHTTKEFTFDPLDILAGIPVTCKENVHVYTKRGGSLAVTSFSLNLHLRFPT